MKKTNFTALYECKDSFLPTSIKVGAFPCWFRFPVFSSAISLAAFLSRRVLAFGFSLWFGKLGFVKQVVHFSIKQGKLHLDILG